VLVGGNVSFGGAVLVEDYVSIGVGASIKPGVRLRKGCTVGVGAAVVKDVPPGITVVGVPAKPI
jgi:acetyltransferase EpsM